MVSIAFGKVAVAAMLDVVSSKNLNVSSTLVYIVIGLLGALYTIYSFFFMKDVVNT